MSRIYTDDAHSSTGSAETGRYCLFPGSSGTEGNTGYQLLMKYRVKQKPNRRNIEADISEY
ncbi:MULTISPECIES: hypothetical protein [Chryseobacterium]|uniref:hypothetical protein n=1 Tax=Chryseobacterium TaxID=59732 RepID=UPI0023E11D98|nr:MULTISPECIES: hypothetical protein [Chryseobacterium]WES98421.1 hypothetical protein P2W68_02130 [Chryseobacterium arthrosphaerae]